MTALDPTPSDSAERAPHRRSPGMRWVLLLSVVVTVLLLGYLVVAGLLAVVTGTAGGAEPAPPVVLLAAVPAWLAAFQVPLSITGAPLTALPSLPTILMMVLIARASSQVMRRSRVRRPEQALWVVLSMGFAHAAAGTLLALLVEGTDGPVELVPADAFTHCGLIATVASGLGVVNRCGVLYLLWERVPAEAWWGLRCGVLGFAALVGVGALVSLGALCLSAPELVAKLGPPAAAAGGTLVSLLYLPDAVLAAWSFTTGVGVSLGELVFRPLAGTAAGGSLPDVPLLGLLPDSPPQPWWWGLFACPVAVGVLVGWTCRTVHESLVRRLCAVLVAASALTLAVLVPALVVGGHLGGGRFDPVTLHPAALAVATLCWIAVPAAATAWVTGPQPEEATGELPVSDPEVRDEPDEDAGEETAATDTTDSEEESEAPDGLEVGDETAAEGGAEPGDTPDETGETHEVDEAEAARDAALASEADVAESAAAPGGPDANAGSFAESGDGEAVPE